MEALLRAERSAPQILSFFKSPAQVHKCIEEMAELTIELTRLLEQRRKNPGQQIPAQLQSDLQGEVADVLLMAMQMRVLVGKPEVDMVIAAKIERTFARIRGMGGVVFEPVATGHQDGV